MVVVRKFYEGNSFVFGMLKRYTVGKGGASRDEKQCEKTVEEKKTHTEKQKKNWNIENEDEYVEEWSSFVQRHLEISLGVSSKWFSTNRWTIAVAVQLAPIMSIRSHHVLVQPMNVLVYIENVSCDRKRKVDKVPISLLTVA